VVDFAPIVSFDSINAPYENCPIDTRSFIPPPGNKEFIFKESDLGLEMGIRSDDSMYRTVVYSETMPLWNHEQHAINTSNTF
jgi:hypothetical protein